MKLEAEDDAATANWGDAWCTPTYEQLIELYDECTWTKITQNGANGYKVTGPNGNCIFFPAAGGHHNKKQPFGEYGFYWSSSLNEYNSDEARCLFNPFFARSYASLVSGSERCFGFTIRPVAR